MTETLTAGRPAGGTGAGKAEDMDRTERLRLGISKTDRGIEVAPWFNPTVAKRDGYNVATLDVFDTDTLRRRANEDSSLMRESGAQIEEVDFVGSATEIADLVPAAQYGTFDYVVSSHNFEHLPNPIKFLQGCEKILKPGGLISMAVPDLRTCFDYFKPHSTTGEWLEAYKEDRKRPSARQVYDGVSLFAQTRNGNGVPSSYFRMGERAVDVDLAGNSISALDRLHELANSDTYIDAHCTVTFPEVMHLLLLETRYLGLIHLDVESISQAFGHEFFIRLRRPLGAPLPLKQAEFESERQNLVRLIVERRYPPLDYLGSSRGTAGGLAIRLAASVVGIKLTTRIQKWNRARLAASRARRRGH